MDKDKKSIVEAEKKTNKGISRRDFGKIAATLGIASFAGAGTALQAEENSTILRENMDIKYIDGVVQWKVDRSKFQRFRSENVAFNSYSRKVGKTWYKERGKTSFRLIEESKYHPKIPAPSKADARAVEALENSAGTFKSMTPLVEGFSSFWNDKPYKIPKPLLKAPYEKNPEKLTVQAKLAARLFGADIVGTAKLNRDWMYASYQDNPHTHKEANVKEIVFQDVDKMIETDTQLIIPNSVNNVIVTAYEQNRELIQTAPSSMSSAASRVGYSRTAMGDIQLAQFIRALGYIAIPCGNTYGLSVPMAVEAGLGEAGRMGTLITPEFGPNVRLGKVLTNMPLIPDKPIEFGVQEFCETCKKCARECPSESITEGPKSWSPRNICNQPGVYKWYNDYEKCLQYWMDNGSGCGICNAVCPFTKGAIWVHDGVRFVIDKMRWAQPVMLGLDDAFGYGERRKEEDVWNMSIGTYGLDQRHFKNSIEKGKFPL